MSVQQQRSTRAGGVVERRRAREQRMRHVLEVAARTFAAQGFHDASMDEIARAAGVSKPVVYTHFASKDGLYEAVLLHASREFAERVRSGVAPEQTPESRMWAGVLAFVDAVEEHPEWWVLTRQAALAGDPFATFARRVNEATSELIAGLLTETAALAGVVGAAATIEVLAHAFVGGCAATADWWITHPETPKGTVAITLMNMMWMGFGDLAEAKIWLPPEARQTP
jgi:AcrR family transcriptional regulator